MIVLGIDPGTANTGYGVVATRSGRMVALDGGVITTAASDELPTRLLLIHQRVTDLIAEHSPEAVSIEDLYFGKNVGSALAVGHARGVVMLAAGQADIPCFSYTPQQIKSSVCGQGSADKQQVTTMVQQLLSLSKPPTPDHAADALAAAICHSSHAPFHAASA
ncbi:MAG: crossover junction endodeoxyribonuclease RuvC [Solirubrobacterales bacterium]|nr:crossover junction endodeoxyribonuclease RuvC [Solirubrobacterales bacterium]